MTSSQNAKTVDNFQMLLDWLDTDRRVAAEKYEKIRWRLGTMLAGRGCYESEELVNLTIDRVIDKLPEVRETYVGEPMSFFYGVAKNVLHEWCRKKAHEQRALDEMPSPQTDIEAVHICLDKCLKTMPPENQFLLLEYYRKEKNEKIVHRRKLGEHLGIKPNALRIRVSRLRERLGPCIDDCLESNAPETFRPFLS